MPQARGAELAGNDTFPGRTAAPPPGRREIAKRETRRRLLAAVREMTAEGVAISIAAAARRAGIGVATAYRYYSDLDSLRTDAALRTGAGGDLIGRFRVRIEGLRDPEERLVAAQQQLAGFVDGNEIDCRMFQAKAQEQRATAAARGLTADPLDARPRQMIDAAMEPVRSEWPDRAYRGLVLALMLVIGPEPWLVLRDAGGLTAQEALSVSEIAVRDTYRSHRSRRDRD